MDYVLIEADCIKAATDRAVLAVIDGEEHWIPRSVIEDGDDIVAGGDPEELSVAEWFVNKEGLPAS